MYIPTIFLGTSGNCVTIDISGSYLPDGITLGQVVSGSTTYFYIKSEKSVYFNVASGVTNNAKLLVIGGGGGVTAYQANPGNPSDSTTGGGGAGTVVWQDIPLQPGKYFMSASLGGDGTNGQNSYFRAISNDEFPTTWTEYVGYGGEDNTNANGGNNPSYNGGTGIPGTQGAGGGGAGSAGNGTNATQITNYSVGGNGGSGSVIPSPFNSVVGYSVVAGGGAGKSYSGYDGSATAGGAWGSGATRSGTSTTTAGENGLVVLFIPQDGCFQNPTGSIPIPTDNFFATGGTTGTFLSGSVTYKYHLFTNDTKTELFKVRSGYTNEAKVMMIAGGAGSMIKPLSLSGRDYPNGAGGGAGAGGLKITENVKLYGLNNLVDIGGGGTYAVDFDAGTQIANGTGSLMYSTDNNLLAIDTTGGGAGAGYGTYQQAAQIGGSGGGGFEDTNINGAAGIAGQGYSGGNGFVAGGTLSLGAGGSGGGAGGVGLTPVNSFTPAEGGPGYTINGIWSFLTSSLFTASPIIGIGGGGGTGNTYPGYIPTASIIDLQANDGSGANPIPNGGGNAGFAAIIYPISGSITNS